ncbi:MAG TPA: aldo/keto reductase [Candidatus Angelobacter sp.]|jgi:aryl-alcohol dehydrogenase-like predicted oxidoreductase|nr:aldo/keto reductase [Candidatus Angelobacter sp.]
MHRREFLRGVALAGIAARGARGLASSFAGGLQSTASGNKEGGPMIYRTLGRTGERVSAIGMGGFHIGKPSLTDDDSIKLIRAAIDGGINFMDNSWDYNNGQSEIRMGKALKDGYRQKVFLMTKLDGRTKEEATKQINESLQRLQTDRLDLIQHHEIIRFDDPDRIFAENGAHEAVLEAKKAGKVRYIGFTGHKDPHVHLYMLEVGARNGFTPDTVQMPVNVMDAHFRSFTKLVLPKLVEQKIGVLGMKSMGDGIILKSGVVKPEECLRYALSQPTSVVITGIDKAEILQQALTVAKDFKPMSKEEIAALLAKTETVAAKGEYELFKTSAHFDSTAHHPEWLGGQAPHVDKLAGPPG